MTRIPSEVGERIDHLQQVANAAAARAAEARNRLGEIAERRHSLTHNAIHNLGARAVADELDRLAAEELALRAVIEESEAATALLTEVKAWHSRATDNGRFVYANANLPTAKRKPGESWADAVEQVRQEIAELRHKRRATEAAPATTGEAKARLQAFVDRLAASAKPTVTADGNVELRAGAGFAGLLAWAMPQTMLKALERELPPASPGALSAADKAAALDALADQIAAAELEEEATIRAAEAAGEPVLRRADARVLVVLGLVQDGFVLPEEAEAA